MTIDELLINFLFNMWLLAMCVLIMSFCIYRIAERQERILNKLHDSNN